MASLSPSSPSAPAFNGNNNRRRSSVFSQLEQSLHSHIMSTVGLCSSVFATFFIAMSVFPYSGYMALQLAPSTTKETAGVYAGFLSSAFMVGRGCTSVFWGQLADIYGRKFVLVVASITSIVGNVMFGCSTSYAMAVTIRFGMGLGNGTMVVARTASSELAKGNKKLESKTVGLIMSMVGYGMLISPAVGGFLSEPLQQHPNNAWFQEYSGVLERFPFILPNLVAAILSVVSLFTVMLCVKETLPSFQRRSWVWVGKDCGMFIYKWCCMNRNGRERASLFTVRPTTSIYVSDNQAQEPKDEFENEFSIQGGSSIFVGDDGDLDEEFEDEWEEAEVILDSMEFVVAATMVASHEDRRSFVTALRKDPPPPISEDQERQASNDRSPFSRVSFSNEKTPLFSNPQNRESTSNSQLQAFPTKATITKTDSTPENHRFEKCNSTLTDISVRTKPRSSMKDIMQNPRTRIFLISNWLCSFATVAQSEAFPLFAMANPRQGLGMGETSIGMVGTFSGLIYCIGQYYTSSMMNKFGHVKSIRLGALFANLPVILIPVVLYIPSPWIQIGYLSFLCGVSMIFASVYQGCNTIGANRTVDATSRASMNGLSSLGTSIGRGLGPIFAGFLVTACMAPGISPPQLGGWILYCVLLAIGLMSYWYTHSIPDDEDNS